MPRRAAAAVALAACLLAVAPARAAQTYPIEFHAFPPASAATFAGTALDAAGAITLAAKGLSRITYADPFGYPARDYLTGTWTSPWHATPAPFTELVASWNASTPAGTWIEVRMRARAADGHVTKAYVLGRWASGDADFHRTSVGGQGDADGFVAVDTFFAKDHPLAAYQLELALNRAVGSTASPTVTRIGAVASDPVNTNPVQPSATTMTRAVVLPVPQYSQEIHAGQYPQFDGGGEAWCSPTSTSMVLAYWGRGPAPAEYAFVLADYPATADPWVDYAARFTFDYRFAGAGNWPFNIAYAARFGLEGEVTQLHSLAEAEQFVKAGIPLVASIAFSSNKLDGFLFKSTSGHLLVIVGFDAAGNPIVNDPAAPSDAAVQRTYDRAQFERAWQKSTGGIVYVIHPAAVQLPPSPDGNW